MTTTTRPIKHTTASAIILTRTKPAKALLVHHRKYNVWIQPGGHQESHENSLEAVIREVKEETSIDIAPYLPAPVVFDQYATQLPAPSYLLQELIQAHDTEPEHYHLDQIYVVRIPEQKTMHNQLESHDIRWFTAEELDTLPTYENVRILLKQELSI